MQSVTLTPAVHLAAGNDLRRCRTYIRTSTEIPLLHPTPIHRLYSALYSDS